MKESPSPLLLRVFWIAPRIQMAPFTFSSTQQLPPTRCSSPAMLALASNRPDCLLSASAASWRKLHFQISSAHRWNNEGDVGRNNSSFWLAAPSSRISGLRAVLPVQSSFPAAETWFSPLLPGVNRVIRSHSTKTAHVYRRSVMSSSL